MEKPAWPRRQSTAHAVLFICAIIVYSNTFANKFVWIDHVEIEEGGYRVSSWDDFVALWSGSLEEFIDRDSDHSSLAGGYYRPLYALSVSADWLFWKARPSLYHMENALWHGAAVCLLFAFSRRMLAGHPHCDAISFWSTLIFAVHPFGVHSVTWISGRKDTMCAVFGIASLLVFARTCRLPDEKRKARSVVWLVTVAAVFLVFSILSKELGFVVPIIALACWIAWPRNSGDSMNSIGLVCLVTLWLICLAGWAFRSIMLGGIGLDIEHPGSSLMSNLATYSRLWWQYVWRIFVPVSPTIVDRWRITQQFGFIELLSILALFSAALATIVGLAKRSKLAMLSGWFGIWMLPASGLLPLRHLYAERYLYPASWGLIALTAYLVFSEQVSKLISSQIRVVILSSYVIVLALMTKHENQFWYDDKTLLEHAIEQDPNYAEGLVGISVLSLKEGRNEDAVKFGQRAIQSASDPEFASYWSPLIANTNIGLGLYNLGDGRAAKAAFQSAIDSHPGNAIGYYHLGLAQQALGEFVDAEKSYFQALGLRPNDFLASSNLGYLYLQTNRLDVCISQLEPLVDQRPNDIKNRENLGTAYLLKDRYRDAEQQFQAIAKLEASAVNLAKLAWAQWKQHEDQAASANLESAVRLDPQHATVEYVRRMVTELKKQ